MHTETLDRLGIEEAMVGTSRIWLYRQGANQDTLLRVIGNQRIGP